MNGKESRSPEKSFPWKEILTLLGVALTAYFGYLGIRASIEIPIRATQTAEQKATAISQNSTIPASTNSLIESSPTLSQLSTPVGGGVTPLPVLTETPVEIVTTPTLVVYDISFRFDGENLDGWKIDKGTITNPGASGNSGGENDGYLRAKPLNDGKTNYFIAPNFIFGDWSGYSSLQVDLWSSGGEYFTEKYEIHGDIYIANGDLIAYRFLPKRPPDKWERFTIPLYDDGFWTLGVGTMSLEDVLVNVTGFQIRAEYGAGSSQDYTGLDNVTLIP